jgi:hypothetical protein
MLFVLAFSDRIELTRSYIGFTFKNNKMVDDRHSTTETNFTGEGYYEYNNMEPAPWGVDRFGYFMSFAGDGPDRSSRGCQA